MERARSAPERLRNGPNATTPLLRRFGKQAPRFPLMKETPAGES